MYKMNEELEALRALIANPDDLSTLPQTIARLEEYHTTVTTRETEDLERITNLQNANRSLLSQIPISTGAPDPPEDSEDEAPTFEDAQAELLKTLNTARGL